MHSYFNCRSDIPLNESSECAATLSSTAATLHQVKESEAASRLVGVERTVRVLRAVESLESPHLAEIARTAQLNEATALRYLSTLSTLGFVERLEGPRYRLGWELCRLGQRALEGFAPSDAVRPTMERLRVLYNETVNFALCNEGSVVLVEVLEGERSIRKINVVGQVQPWHASALGKSILASMKGDDWKAAVGRDPLERYTPTTITAVKKLAEEIAVIREKGYAVDREEVEEEVTCIAAALPPASGPATHALSISFVAHRLKDSDVDDVGRTLIKAAAEIAQRLYW